MTDDNCTQLNDSINQLIDKVDKFTNIPAACAGEDCLQIAKLSVRQKILYGFVGTLIIISTWSYIQFLSYTDQAAQEQKANIATMERLVQKMSRAEADIISCTNDRREIKTTVRNIELDLARLKNKDKL